MSISLASPADFDELMALFPRLSSFEISAERNPKDLWRGDAEILRKWASGDREACFVLAERDADQGILGTAMVTMRAEPLSHFPSAHLEVLVVADGAEGRGIGGALLDAAEQEAMKRGARSMTLHVFASNHRARKVYERAGFDGEIIRYIKTFSKDALK